MEAENEKSHKLFFATTYVIKMKNILPTITCKAYETSLLEDEACWWNKTTPRVLFGTGGVSPIQASREARDGSTSHLYQEHCPVAFVAQEMADTSRGE